MWVYFLNIGSWVLTAVGFSTLMTGFGETLVGEEHATLASFVLGGLVSTVVQIALAKTWLSVGSNGLSKSVITAIIALAFSAASGFGAAASLTTMLGAIQIEDHQLRIQGEQTTAPLQQFAVEYAALAIDMRRLSATSQALSVRESTVGGTCDGDTPKKNVCGSRCRLRKRHARELEALSASAAEFRTASVTISNEMAVATDTEGQRTAYAKAAALNASDTKAEMQGNLSSIISDYEDEYEDGGKIRTCRDESFVSELNTVLATIESPPAIPSFAPSAPRADFSDGATCVGVALGFTGDCKDPSIARLPLGMAGILEFGILFLLMKRGRRLFDMGAIPTASEEFNGYVEPKVTPDKAASARKLVRSHATWSITIREKSGRWFTLGYRTWQGILVPVDGSIDARSDALDLVHELGDLNYVCSVPMGHDLLYPSWIQARAHLLNGAENFELYAAPEDIEMMIKRARRRAKMHAGHQSDDDE